MAKYTQQDIWDFFIYNYLLALTWVTEVDPDADFHPQITTIGQWIYYCDLLPAKTIAKYYYDEFELSTPYSEFKQIMCETDNTLWAFCGYIACYAKRPDIEPTVLAGKECQTTSIFMILKKRLANKGGNVKNLRPSTKLSDYKYTADLVDEVNKLAPNTLNEFIYEPNDWVIKSYTVSFEGFIISFFGIIIVGYFSLSPLLFLLAIILFFIAFILKKLARNFPLRLILSDIVKHFATWFIKCNNA